MISKRSLLSSTAAILVSGSTAHATIKDSNGNSIVTSPGLPYTFTGLNVSGAGTPSTITISSMPTTGTTSSTLSFSFTYTGSAPSGLTAVWQSGSISATVSGFSATSGTGNATVTTPSSAATYTLHITGTGANTSTATAPNSTAVNTGSLTGAPWPGQPGNTVGFAGAPGFTGNSIMTAFSGSFVANTTYSFKIFDAGSNQNWGTNITAGGITFIGCYFGSSSSSLSVGVEAPCQFTGTGAPPVFNYCTFGPSPSVIGGAFPPTPANFTAWPTGSGNACTQAQGYDYGPLTDGNPVSFPIAFTNCDFWGWGNGMIFSQITSSNSYTVRNCWIHDPRNPGSGGTQDHQDGVGDPQDVFDLTGQPDHVTFLTIDHCTIACVGDTQNLALQLDGTDVVNNVTITNNYWAGNETNIEFGITSLSSPNSVTNFVFTGNVIGPTPMTVGVVIGDASNAVFSRSGSGCQWRNNTILPGNYNGATGTVTSATPYIWPDNMAHATDFTGAF